MYRMVHKLLDNQQMKNLYDVVVIGAGAAGMSAAVFAASKGWRILVLESTEFVGGTSAYSAGTTWVPGNTVGKSVNPSDTLDAAKQFLDAAVGSRSSKTMRDAFVDAAAKAVDCMQAHSELQYQVRAFHPDYMSEIAGAVTSGRAIEPKSFDGRLLGKAFKLIRPPIPEFLVLGGMMVDRDDILHLLNLRRSNYSWISIKHAVRVLMRHALDRLAHPRGTRLVMGNALIGRLLYSLQKRGVEIRTDTKIIGLQALPDMDSKAWVLQTQSASGLQSITAKNVIFASGGFNRHAAKRAELLPNIDPAWCVGAAGHTGAAIDLALAQGALLGKMGDDSHLSPAFWAPVSMRKRNDDSTAVFPHFMMDRGKPGMIIVNQIGQRFANESLSYHQFGLAMQANSAWLITDALGIDKYGLGMVRPATNNFDAYTSDGYLTVASTVAELAKKLGMDAVALADSITQINDAAASGVDIAFQRGTTDYQRLAQGDQSRVDSGELKNACLGKIQAAPFYAVQLFPGDIGASLGLVTDAAARVLDANDQPITGLYAVGNDMNSIMGGVYPAPGITLGPGLVFAYLAVEDIAN
jgi:glycine/D-amino acid oxidase-like deaminating enzyme